MLKKNRIFAGMMILILCAGFLAGCDNNADSPKKEAEKEAEKEGTYSVVCTIFPEYDWAREVLGEQSENYQMTLLLDNGIDLHSYQPTAEDIAKIAACDLFIYVGGESDDWVESALKETANPDIQVINLLEVLGDSAKEEETVEGMEAEEEETEEEETEYDEHVWLSLKNAQVFVAAITDSLKIIDEEHAQTYQENCDAYCARLAELDLAYETAVSEAGGRTLLFGDRFPFRYLTDDYGLEYYAAFAGCSAETEASFETTVFLSKKVDELGLSHVCVIEGSDQKLAQTIIDNTAKKDQDILEFDSLQSTTSRDVAEGVTYVSVMEQNLEILKKALDIE